MKPKATVISPSGLQTAMLWLVAAAGLLATRALLRAQARSSHVLRIDHPGSRVEVLVDGTGVRALAASARTARVELDAALQPGPNEVTVRWRPVVKDRPPLRVRLIRRHRSGSDDERRILVDWTSPKLVDVGKAWKRSFTVTVDDGTP